MNGFSEAEAGGEIAGPQSFTKHKTQGSEYSKL